MKINSIKNYNTTFSKKATKLQLRSESQLKTIAEIPHKGSFFARLRSTFAKITDKINMSYEQVLKKNGIVIKDNLAVVEKTGEKYTGWIQGLQSINKKKTTKFVDGIITEKLYHDLLGHELDGVFYSNGIKKYSVSSGNKNYVLYSYDKHGNIDSRLTCVAKDKKKFDVVREMLQECKS